MCVWVCVHAKMLTLRWSSPMGGGVVITRPSHQWESQFPFKRALCSSLPSFPPHSSPTPSASVTLLFSECHLYDFYSSFLAILVSLSLSLTPKCPKSIHFNAFMNALCAPYKSFFSLFWVRRELFLVSFGAQGLRQRNVGHVKVVAEKNWKQDKRLNDKIDGSGIVPPVWMFDDRSQIVLHLDRGRVLSSEFCLFKAVFNLTVFHSRCAHGVI